MREKWQRRIPTDHAALLPHRATVLRRLTKIGRNGNAVKINWLPQAEALAPDWLAWGIDNNSKRREDRT